MTKERRTLCPCIRPIGAWALALGTSIGWGSLVVTSNSYLKQAGPVGSVLGMVIGALVMLIIARNYHYMMNCFPESGGAYTYTKETFGCDHGFLTAWFLCLTYLSIFWANATSLPLFARYFIRNVFRFGKLYTFFGYDVYLGEALLTIGAIVLTGLLCANLRKPAMALLVGTVLLFTAGIAAVFIGAMARRGSLSFEPAYIPDQKALSQVVKVACISPWAFIGFENISHAAEELSFSKDRSFRVLAAAVGASAALYIAVLLLSVSAYPARYANWLEYIRDLDNLEGLEGLPAFYAANHYLGRAGVYILMASLMGLIISSLIGNTLALSRLFYSMAKDQVLPARFAEINQSQVPGNAVWLMTGLSLAIPFFGRTAIGWIVDVTTIGATMVYGFVSAATLKVAAQRRDTLETWTGRVGVAVMIAFGAFLLAPSFFTHGNMEKETFFLLVVWSVLGFLFFRSILRRDRQKRFGRSIIVWIALLTMVLMVSMIWVNQSIMSASEATRARIHSHYTEAFAADRAADEAYIDQEMQALARTNLRAMLAVAGLFAIAAAMMFSNFHYMNQKARESEQALGLAHNLMFTDALTGVKSKYAWTMKEMELDDKIYSGAAGEFAVLVCDLNGLKHINDTRGHKTGDEYIRAGCKLICEVFDHSPVYRVGGDEFVVTLSGRDFQDREALLDHFNQTVEANIGQDKPVVSIGEAVFDPDNDRKVQQVFARTDAQMYHRKQALKAMGAKVRE